MLRAQKERKKTSYEVYKRDLRLILTPGSKKLQKITPKGSPAAPFYVADSLQLNIRAQEKLSNAYLVT